MVWKVSDVVGQQGALKTLIFKNAKFDESKAEHTRVDAILSERLTSSSHVIDIYGACGMSTMSEIGVVHDKWVSRRHDRKTLVPPHIQIINNNKDASNQAGKVESCHSACQCTCRLS